MVLLESIIIWTYAIGFSETFTPAYPDNCPCPQFPGSLPPSFVHNNYYCESGSTVRPNVANYYPNDPVWDGQGCSSNDSCCSEPNLPWFYRQIPLTASEDIEARLCHDDDAGDENILVREFKLYVQ